MPKSCRPVPFRVFTVQQFPADGGSLTGSPLLSRHSPQQQQLLAGAPEATTALLPAALFGASPGEEQAEVYLLLLSQAPSRANCLVVRMELRGRVWDSSVRGWVRSGSWNQQTVVAVAGSCPAAEPAVPQPG